MYYFAYKDNAKKANSNIIVIKSLKLRKNTSRINVVLQN